MSSVAELAGLLGYAEVIGDPSLEVSGLSCDSRSVEEGDLFVCVTGFQSDGHRFAADALAKGAKALVVEKVPEGIDPSVTLIKVGDTRRALAVLSAKYFGCPADKMLNVGITGTNGKTTTAYLTEAVLKAGGYNPGLLGTIEAHVAGKVCKLANTTPGAYDLHSMFSQMHDSGQDSVVMEVSSHALALDRVYGIPFDVAVFTNLTQDHLDFHKTMENYFSTKSKLFTRLGIYDGRAVGPFAVINADDPYGVRLIELIRSRVPVLTYDLGKAGHQIGAVAQIADVVEGILAAAAVGLALRIELDSIVKALESVSAVPGRFQLVRAGQDFTVIVDYAHTPDGLEHLLDSARLITSGKLSLVFGCGGDRDKGKRAVMGRLASEKADKIYITTDNPRSEQPENIVSQIVSGISTENMQYVEIIYDRAQAIAKAIEGAKTGDTVVIAGKGHENYQKFSSRTVHFDDVEQAKSVLSKMALSGVASNAALPRVRLKMRWNRSAFDLSRYMVGGMR